MDETVTKPKCLLDCRAKAKYRGLCHKHNRLANQMIKRSEITDARLVAAGLRLPKPKRVDPGAAQLRGCL